MTKKQEELGWEARRDAETLTESEQIKADPTRLARATEYLKLSMDATKAVLKKTGAKTKGNPATIKKL